jgi:Fe-S-cluster-containing hydrogenase component 2
MACPTGALTQRKGGGVKVKKDLCIRCKECVQACPVDAVALDHDDRPYICIHCGRCIPFCPHHCLELVDTDEEEEGKS